MTSSRRVRTRSRTRAPRSVELVGHVTQLEEDAPDLTALLRALDEPAPPEPDAREADPVSESGSEPDPDASSRAVARRRADPGRVP